MMEKEAAIRRKAGLARLKGLPIGNLIREGVFISQFLVFHTEEETIDARRRVQGGDEAGPDNTDWARLSLWCEAGGKFELELYKSNNRKYIYMMTDEQIKQQMEQVDISAHNLNAVMD